MVPTTVVRSIALLFSFILIALSIIVLYTSGDASYRLATDYASGGVHGMWYGPVNADGFRNQSTNWEFEVMYLKLDYDYSSERFSWAAAGLSIFVGALSLTFETTRLFNSRGNIKNGNSATTSKALSITTIVLPAVTFIVSLAAIIFVNGQNRKVGTATCNWEEELSHEYLFPKPGRGPYTCTKEFAACNVVDNFNGDSGATACVELQISRQTLIPLAIFSGFVALAYGAQLWLAVKEKKNGGFADERVRQLQEGRDEESRLDPSLPDKE